MFFFVLFLGAGPEALRPSTLHVKASVRDATPFIRSSRECTVQHFVGTCLKMVDKRVRLYSLFQITHLSFG